MTVRQKASGRPAEAAYDVIVVGARCAGAPTAMLFARAGYRVLMLERTRFPRDTLSTLYIHQPGVALLDAWGVLDRVTATGCPPITSAMHQLADVRLEGAPAPVRGIGAAYAPRRYLLDSVLAEAATEAGVEFREQCQVTGLVFAGDRVAGVRWRAGAATGTDVAALVVGADGMRSLVADAVSAPVTLEHPSLSCVYYGYWEGVQADRFEAYAIRGRWVGCVPTNDGRTLIGVYFPQREYPSIRTRAESAYLDGLRAAAPELYERARAGTRTERLFGCGAQPNFFRRAAGSGWALVGDAGHHKDSITADGITAAFRQAALLTASIGGDLHDGPLLCKALARYARQRDRVLAERYTDALALARLRPDRGQSRLAAIADDPAQVQRFFDRAAGPDPDQADALQDGWVYS